MTYTVIVLAAALVVLGALFAVVAIGGRQIREELEAEVGLLAADLAEATAGRHLRVVE